MLHVLADLVAELKKRNPALIYGAWSCRVAPEEDAVPARLTLF